MYRYAYKKQADDGMYTNMYIWVFNKVYTELRVFYTSFTRDYGFSTQVLHEMKLRILPHVYKNVMKVPVRAVYCKVPNFHDVLMFATVAMVPKPRKLDIANSHFQERSHASTHT